MGQAVMKILDWGLIAAAGVLAVLVAVLTLQLAAARSDLDHEKKERADEKALAAQEYAKAVEAFRQKEALWRAERDTRAKEIEDAKDRNAKLASEVAPLRVVAAGVAGMREQLGAARRAAARAAEDATAACDARAGAYEAALADSDRALERVGRSLGQCRGDAITSAHAHDDRADEVVGLVHAWPQ